MCEQTEVVTGLCDVYVNCDQIIDRGLNMFEIIVIIVEIHFNGDSLVKC